MERTMKNNSFNKRNQNVITTYEVVQLKYRNVVFKTIRIFLKLLFQAIRKAIFKINVTLLELNSR